MLDRLARDYFDAARGRLGADRWRHLTSVGADLPWGQAVFFALAEAERPDHDRNAAAENAARLSR